MGERTNKIWQDDDGEKTPASGKKRRGLKRFAIFFLTLTVVLGVVLLAAWRDGTGFDILRRYWNYGSGETSGGSAAYQYDPSPRNRFALLGDSLAVLSDTRLSLLSPDGEEIWSAAVNMTAPALSSGGGRAVAYDVGGTELYVLDQTGELLHLTAAEEEPFIAAALNQNGWLAVTTECKGAKGLVRVYDDQQRQVMQFTSTSRFVLDACVTDDNTRLAAVTLGQEDSIFLSNVLLYDLTKPGDAELSASYEIRDGLVAAITQQESQLVTVSDTCLTYADTKGTVSGSYDYHGLYLRGYALGGEDFTALLLNRYESGSVGKLVTVDQTGTERASLDVNREVLDISAAGRYLGVLYTDSLVIYNQDLQVYASLNGTDFATGVLLRPDGSALLLASEKAGLFLP